jgi:hypothetical protein
MSKGSYLGRASRIDRNDGAIIPMPNATDPTLAPLVGSWCLRSCTLTFSDTKERVETYGQKPAGRMVFEPGGRIMFLFMKPDRTPPEDDTARANQFAEMVAYSGSVRSEGPGHLITMVDLSWNSALLGEQTRFYRIDGDRLTVWTPEQAHPSFPGRLVRGDLIWQRE